MTEPTSDMLRLQQELTDCHWELMRRMADACLDAGLEEEAAGWRWLADNKRWPRSVFSDDVPGYSFYDRMDSKVIDDDDLPGDLCRFWDNHKAAFGPRRGDTLSETLRRAARAAGTWLASQQFSPPAPRRRTRAEVLAERERAVYGGCCERFADNRGCNCLEEAEG